jgi:hypothetical protein
MTDGCDLVIYKTASPNLRYRRKGGAKRHRKVLRDIIQGITKPAIRHLARKGGVLTCCLSVNYVTDMVDGNKIINIFYVIYCVCANYKCCIMPSRGPDFFTPNKCPDIAFIDRGKRAPLNRFTLIF